jgi:hypothetical protein
MVPSWGLNCQEVSGTPIAGQWSLHNDARKRLLSIVLKVAAMAQDLRSSRRLPPMQLAVVRKVRGLHDSSITQPYG